MSADLAAQVREAASGTPYTVTSVEGGFDVALDLADAQWWGLFNRAGMRRAMSHEVRLRDDGTYAITDVERRLDWVAGEPRVAATMSVQRGRIISFGGEQVWAIGDSGRIEAVVDYRFDTAEGRRLIEVVADRMGLVQVRGTPERLGLIFGVVAGIGALLTAIILLVLALLGKF